MLVEFCPKVFRNYHLKAGRRDFIGRGLYSMTKQGLKNWQQCSLAVSAQDRFLNRWQPLWKIQVQFLMKMRNRLGRLGGEYPASLQKTAFFKLSTCHEVAVSQSCISSVLQKVLGGQQWYKMISVCSSLLCVAFCSTFY